MSKMPETTVIPPIPSGSTRMRSGTPVVRYPLDRRWVLTGLIVLIAASAVEATVAVGTSLRRTTAMRSTRRPGPGAGIGRRPRRRGRGLNGDPHRGDRPPEARHADPGRPSGRAEVSPPPQPKQDATEPPPRVSMLLNPVPVPARPAADRGGTSGGGSPIARAELFARKWQPDDPRCHGGDGLGPLYNADSCLACHNAGGAGGAGAASTNVEVATPIGYAGPTERLADLRNHRVASRIGTYRVESLPKPTGRVMIFEALPEPTEMVRIHPGFRDATSLVLHHFGVDPAYSQWLATVHSLSGKRGSP